MTDGSRESFSIAELAERTGVTRRTVHYYIGRGLLPPAEGAGKASFYTEAHRVRILSIKRMQAEFLPLEEIRRRLEEYDDSTRIEGPAAVPAAEAPQRTGHYPGRRMVRIDLDHGIVLLVPEDDEEAAGLAARMVRLADRERKEV